MALIYVRLRPKARQESFHRCAIRFTKQWKAVEADEATFNRLKAEQMLEVSETKPDDLDEATPNAVESAGVPGADGTSAPPAPAPQGLTATSGAGAQATKPAATPKPAKPVKKAAAKAGAAAKKTNPKAPAGAKPTAEPVEKLPTKEGGD